MELPTPEQLAEVNIHVFLEHYGITNDQGEKLDFKNHPFLWDIYEDFSPKQAILKAAQIGFSTAANIKALWIAKNLGMDIIYSLPSAHDVREFVGGKTNRLIGNNPIFQQWTADKDSIESKRVGRNQIYFRGTQTEQAALAIPADLYISDETDRSKQEIVSQYVTRLQHSKYGWRWYFSNPSAPGVGVDKHWKESDQKHWFVFCECGHAQYMTMDNIVYADPPYFGCVKCKRELDRRNGAWVKKYENKEVSGYWISLLMCPWVSASDVLKKKSEMTEEQFTNFVLGMPYIGRGNKLTEPLLFQNLNEKTNPQDARTIIGIDTGNKITYVMGNKHGLFFNGEADDWSEIDMLLHQRPTAIAVIDQGGDIKGPRKLREKYPGRVFLCYFGPDRKNDQIVRWNFEDGSVVADRDKIIQLVVDEFTEKRIPMQGNRADWWDFWLHWDRLYRIDEEDLEKGTRKRHWAKAAIPCDFPFATVYWRIGMDQWLETGVTFNEPNGKVDDFAFTGMEIGANGTGFLPKYRLVA